MHMPFHSLPLRRFIRSVCPISYLTRVASTSMGGDVAFSACRSACPQFIAFVSFTLNIINTNHTFTRMHPLPGALPICGLIGFVSRLPNSSNGPLVYSLFSRRICTLFIAVALLFRALFSSNRTIRMQLPPHSHHQAPKKRTQAALRPSTKTLQCKPRQRLLLGYPFPATPCSPPSSPPSSISKIFCFRRCLLPRKCPAPSTFPRAILAAHFFNLNNIPGVRSCTVPGSSTTRTRQCPCRPRMRAAWFPACATSRPP